jgi:diguanylate cyclase (GGDEF)-like protein/PAS domain S-box-containing protein
MSLVEDYSHTLSVCEKRLDALHVTLQFFIKLGAKQVAVCLSDEAVEGQMVVRLSHGMKEASNKILKGGALGNVAAFEACKNNRVIRVDDYMAQSAWVRTDLEAHVGIESALYVPIAKASERRAHGVVIAVPERGKCFTDEELQTAAFMGAALSHYLETHPVHVAHSGEALHEGSAAATPADLAEAYQHCIDTKDIYELSDRTMEYCLKFTRSEFGFVGYIDPATGFLTVPTLTKEIFPESKIEGKTMVFEKPGGLGGLVLDTDRPVVANDPLAHPASVGTPPGHLPIRKFMGIPCMIHGKKVGMIALANKLEDYTQADLKLAETFATLYATSVSSIFARGALMETKDKYMALYNDAPVAYFTMDTDGRIDDINESGKRLLQTGVEEGERNFNTYLDEVSQALLNERIREERRHTSDGPIELTLQAEGIVHTVLLSMTPIFDERGYLRSFRCSAVDISLRKAAEAQLNFLAYHDEATGIANRAMMRRALEQALVRAKRNRTKVGVFFFDLDRFKTINDTLGHAVGDALLREVASKLKVQFREADLLSRFGGDEFVLIVDNVAETEAMTRVAQKLLDLFAEPFRIGERSLYISSSIGISIYPDDAVDAEEMIKNADTAMYRGKERGGNNFTFYQQHFNIAAHERLTLEGEMREALKQREFLLHYQPQYDIRTGAIIGVEALLRWKHGERGMIAPLEFIPLAEENGFIIPLGTWVMEEALKQLRHWHDLGYIALKMSVNVSAKQLLHSDGLYGQLRDLLHHYALDSAAVCLEITESTLANIEEMSRRLNEIRTLGVSFAVDDFGTGYSSLSYLRRLPITILKIDKSFVDDIGKNPDDEAISMAIISMAHTMGMEVVAEGVESREHLEFLTANGCDYYQGYYRSRPLPAGELTRLLKESV